MWSEESDMKTKSLRAAVRPARMLALAVLGALGTSVLAQTKTAASVQWTKVSVDLPVSAAVFPAGDGAPIADGYCLMCHSAGMVLRQPPLTEAQWLAEVQKMRALWGAPIPADQDTVLAKYLAHINGPGTARQPSPTAATSK
jgi:mono/diheme cytochrome c family protein